MPKFWIQWAELHEFSSEIEATSIVGALKKFRAKGEECLLSEPILQTSMVTDDITAGDSKGNGMNFESISDWVVAK